MSDPRRERSRFGSDEPESSKRARFDSEQRRSRSPSRRESESHRERSPKAREGGAGSESPAVAAVKARAAAAAAAAARINAQIQAKRSMQPVEAAPIRAVPTPPVAKSPFSNSAAQVTSEPYQQDGDHIKDIEINDLRNRYTLTKGATQKRIKDETGADVTTRGEYFPDKNMATATNPPLYLRITSTSKEGLDKAVAMIEEMMKEDLPNLVDERRFRRREPEPFERDEFGRRKWPEEKISVGLEPISGFNLRAQVVGRGGDNVKYIQQETGCKVQIKGRGSGFMEPQSGQESEEPMYLHIAGPRPEGVARAKQLCDELLEKIKADYQDFKERGPIRYGERDGGYGGGRPGYGDRGDRDRSSSYGYGANGAVGAYGGTAAGYGGTSGAYVDTTGAYVDPTGAYVGTTGAYGVSTAAYSGGVGAYGGYAQYGTSVADTVTSPVTAAPTDANGQAYDYTAVQAWILYYQQHPEQDPYAAQGGYGAYLASYYQNAYGTTQSPGPGAGAGPAQPSDPYGVAAQPPNSYGAAPPATAASPGGYSAVPPPPGL